MIHPQVVSHPKLVLVLGFIGLTSDLLGVFFHDSDTGEESSGAGHGHSHKTRYKEPVVFKSVEQTVMIQAIKSVIKVDELLININ